MDEVAAGDGPPPLPRGQCPATNRLQAGLLDLAERADVVWWGAELSEWMLPWWRGLKPQSSGREVVVPRK